MLSSGICDSTGSHCLCDDPTHRKSSERCGIYHVAPVSDEPIPTTCPAELTFLPVETAGSWGAYFVPTPAPSPASPTFKPVSIDRDIPATPVCLPGDHVYCHGNGYCNIEGNGCRCEDQEHYWDSERCQFWHSRPKLDVGLFCQPNQVDAYCSRLGVCDEEGKECLCFDSTHRKSSTRCGVWYPSAGNAAACSPGDRKYCNGRGFCNSLGEGCICDDPELYWSGERCSSKHKGPELVQGQCCSPGATDYYCNWQGTCAADGSACICFNQHRYPSERCQYWHEFIDPTKIEGNFSGTCPPLIELTVSNDDDTDTDTLSTHQPKSSSNGDTALWIKVFFPILSFLIICVAIFFVWKYVVPSGGKLSPSPSTQHPNAFYYYKILLF
jgi:hypothetical protein